MDLDAARAAQRIQLSDDNSFLPRLSLEVPIRARTADKDRRHSITHILAGYTYVNAISDRFKLKPINVDPETNVVSVRG